jgi:hypothetical protein
VTGTPAAAYPRDLSGGASAGQAGPPDCNRSYSLIRPSTSARTVANGTIRSVPDDSDAPAARLGSRPSWQRSMIHASLVPVACAACATDTHWASGAPAPEAMPSSLGGCWLWVTNCWYPSPPAPNGPNK